MSRRKTASTSAPEAAESSSLSSNAKLLAVALLAGVVGAGIMWMLLPARQGVPPDLQPPAVVAAVEPPPNVENLPPAQAALLLGLWHYDRQRWTAAVEQYEAALSLGVDNADVRTDLGNCYRFLSQPEKARDQYERSQRQNPQHENSLFNLATLYSQALHDPAKARDLLNEYLRRFPASGGALRAHQLLAELEQAKPAPDTDRLLRALVTDTPEAAK